MSGGVVQFLTKGAIFRLSVEKKGMKRYRFLSSKNYYPGIFNASHHVSNEIALFFITNPDK